MCLENATGLAELPVASSQQLLEQLARRELDSDDVSITLSAGSAKGDNYIGIVFRARVECRQTGKQLNIIVKLPPQSEARRNQFFARPSFEREICFYTEIYPMMVEFQREKGIELDDGQSGFNQIPRCLQTSLVEYEEAIFMNDLKEAGFEMFDRHQLQGIEHHRLLVKTLGRFHAISFAMKDQQPERIAPYKEMVELFATRADDGSLDTWFTALIERTLGTLDEQTEPEVYNRTKNALKGKFMHMIKELTTGENAEPYAVICHGDCWNNNMLFKNEDGKPVDIRLLDWQICRYASPVLDLMYFIFTASTKEFRELHYESLLDLYHESLADFLRRLGSDPEKLFPRKALDDQLQRFGRFGLLMSVMLLPVINTKSEDVPDLEAMSEKLESGADLTEDLNSFHSEETDGIYREKMSGCCQDMVRLGYI